MGGLEDKIKNTLTSLLFSLTKIEPLRRYFYYKNFTEGLCRKLANNIKNNDDAQIKAYIKSNIKTIKEIKDVKEEKIAEMVFKYILEEISKELKEDEEANILIKELFYGYYELNPENGKKEKIYLEKPLIFSIDLSQLDLKTFTKTITSEGNNESCIILSEIIKNKFKEIMIKEYPELRNNNVHLPEICAITLSKFKDNQILYYLSQDILNVPYELIYFMIDDEDDDDEKRNFFIENSFWSEYPTKNNIIKDIDNIKEIKLNPRMLFYQKKNYLIQNFLTNKSLISQEKKRILDLMNEHIIPEHSYENYYLINKNLLNEIEKNLNDPKDSEENIYKNTRFMLKKMNLLDIGEDIDKNIKLKIPKNFLIFQENVYKEILEKSDVDYIVKKRKENDYEYTFRNDLIEKKYLVKFGENLAFIKMEEDNYFMKKENNEQERIFVCCYDEKNESFDVKIIMKYYKKGGFEEDLKKYISNRGGMEYFYKVKNLDIKKDSFQDICENGEKIGELANLNMETRLDMNRYKMLNFLYKYENYEGNNTKGIWKKVSKNSISSDVYGNPINLIAKESENKIN